MNAVEKRIKEDLAAGHVAGVSVYVAQGGKTLYENHLGNATPNSLFRIASMTKPITTVAVLKLWEAGELSVEDPVVKYLPGFMPQLQIKHLLTHTSGLSQKDYAQRITDAHRADANLLVDFIAGLDFDHAPGSYPEYSPVAGFALLTAIAERTAGMDFASFAHDTFHDRGNGYLCYHITYEAEKYHADSFFADVFLRVFLFYAIFGRRNGGDRWQSRRRGGILETILSSCCVVFRRCSGKSSDVSFVCRCFVCFVCGVCFHCRKIL